MMNRQVPHGNPKPSMAVRWLLFFAASTLGLLVLCAGMGIALLNRSRNSQFFSSSDLVSGQIAIQAKGKYDMFTPLPDPKVDMTFLPGLRDQLAWNTQVPLSTNSSGFRFPREFKDKEEGTFRIVLLGDSFIAATGVKYEDGPAPQLEGMLNRALSPGSHPYSKVEVYPLGVGGWNIFSEIAFLIHNLHRLQPDLVIHAICGNDFDSGYGFILGHVRSALYDMQGLFGASHFSIASPSHAIRKKSNVRGLVGSYLIPESRRRFHLAAGEVRHLKKLLARHCQSDYIVYLYSPNLAYGICESFEDVLDKEKIILTPAVVLENNLLPQDAHPDREGHRYMALALSRYFYDHSLLPLREEVLADEGPYAPYVLASDHTIDKASVMEEYCVSEIPSQVRITEDRFIPDNALRTVVGGLFKGGELSMRTCLVLARETTSRELLLELVFPPVPALDGGKMAIFINGNCQVVIDMTTPEGMTSKVRLSLEHVPVDVKLIEIVLEGDRYYTDPYHAFKKGLFGYAPRCGRLISAALLP